MSERYSRVFSLPENLYAAGAPVMIAAGALLKDNQAGNVLAQLKLRSISPKAIKAVTVAVYPQDTVGKALGDAVTHQYLDLSENRDREFGQKQPIVLPDVATRGFSAEVKEVIFADNSMWTGTEEPWEPLPQAIPLDRAVEDRELRKQYQLYYGKAQKNQYQSVKDIWFCGCGAVNGQAEAQCHHCGIEAAKICDPDWDRLKVMRDERLAAEKIQAQTDAEKMQARAKEVKKIAAIAAAVLAAVIAIFVLVPQVVVSGRQYKAAEELLNNGQYEEALYAFENLGDYKDSEDKVAECESLIYDELYDEVIKWEQEGAYREYWEAYDALERFCLRRGIAPPAPRPIDW